MRVWLLLCLAACIQPSYETCPDLGIICPNGTVCDPTHHACVTPAQQEACVGLAEGAPCTAGSIHGTCDQGVCLATRCGDGIVETGEACDDGNTRAGDGCNAICTSTEVCGNGYLDAGETCDDGNTIAGDGCDSKCSPEVETWKYDGVALFYAGPYHTAYDAAHHQLINVTDGGTWTWDGSTWRLLDIGDLSDSLSCAWSQLVAAPDRQSLLLVCQDSTTLDLRVWEWDGSAWSPLSLPPTPPNIVGGVTYDSVRHVLLAISQDQTTGTFVLSQLDLSTSTWSQLASPPSDIGTVVFDAGRGVTVAIGNGTTYEWNGASWKSKSGVPANGATLIYDPSNSAVIAVGGNPARVAKWTGTSWTTLAAEAPPVVGTVGRFLPDVVYDVDRGRLVLFGGTDFASNFEDLYEWDGTAWRLVPWSVPMDLYTCSYAYDPHRKELIQVRAGEIWVWNGTWKHLPSIEGATSVAFDPVRDAFVVTAFTTTYFGLVTGNTWLVRDDSQVLFEQPSASAGITSLTYDPIRGGVIGADKSTTWELASTAMHWSQIADSPFPPGFGTLQSIAFDARRGSFVGQGTVVSTDLYELVGSSWTGTLGPGAGYSVVGDPRRGSVLAFAPEGRSWERLDGVWHPLPALLQPVTPDATYAADTATLFVVGAMPHSRLMLRRTFVGASPLEACDGADLDDDGLVDCADPDCWWACTPQCPPHVSCP